MAEALVLHLLSILKETYPEAKCSLAFKTPFQLVIATLLSAQCTDERVNRVTPSLFNAFPTAEKMAKADVRELEEQIKSVNFFRTKAKALSECSRRIMGEFGGEVPSTLEQLITLKGVGRKTANVVLGVAFKIPGVVVDTHVGRLARRMGLTKAQDPARVERDLMARVPMEDWTVLAHLLIDHGRLICTARRAYCESCRLEPLCPQTGVLRGGEIRPMANASQMKRPTRSKKLSLKGKAKQPVS